MTTHLRKLMEMAATLLPLLLSAGQLRAQSALDGFDPNADREIHAIAVQTDGKILLGGNFTMLSPNGGPAVTRNGIARLNPDGTLDTAFNPDANGGVYSIVVQPDGKILVGGFFNGTSSIGGQTRNRIARLDPATGLADSFDPNASGGVIAIAVQADGKILAGGFFTGTNSIGGQTRNHIARLDATTGLPDSFDPNANDGVHSIALQADGKILVGGRFNGTNSIGGQTRNCIARLDPTTGLADSFNPDAGNAVNVITVQADGRILVGGEFNFIGGQPRNEIARLDATTGLPDSFDPNANLYVTAIAVQADGKILLGGFFGAIGGQLRSKIARVDPVTGLPDSFNPNAQEIVYAIAVQPDGKILAGGIFSVIGGQLRRHIARLEKDGRLDQTLNANIVSVPPDPFTSGFVGATVTQPDGKIVIGGFFSSVLGVERHNIARLNTDGSLDIAFNPDTNGIVYTIAIQEDGKIVVGGGFSTIAGQARMYMARLDATTGLPDSFKPDPGGNVLAIAIQADGKILAGGGFRSPFSIGGQLRRFIARLDPTTGLADSFNPDPNDLVYSIAVQADGKILIGGEFTQVNGQNRNRIARIDAVTGLVDSFNPDANGSVRSIAVQTDGKFLASGGFTTIGGQTRHLFARLDGTTGMADSFDPSPQGGFLNSIALQADGKILAGGYFNSIGGQTRHRIARLDGVTGLADSFDPNANYSVDAIAVQPDGKILVGGEFNGPGSIGGQSRDWFGRLSNDTAALQNLVVSRTTIKWKRGGSSPALARVTFEYSTDNVNYTALGSGTAAGRDWTLSGLSLPLEQNFYVRARGRYRGGYLNGSESIAEFVRNAFIPPRASSLGNISTRLRIQTGDNAMIGGFIITGTEPKTVIMRGIGPSLSMPGVLADPIIEVHGPSGQVLGINDNWNDAATRQQIIDSGLAPTNALESALWGIIEPGPYTVVVRGNNETTGIGLFEVYDLDQTADSKLGNVSTRGFVETGDNVMIGGTIIIGNPPARVLVRAIGPSLANFGVPNVLGDPTLELYDGNGGLVGTNNNWRDEQENEIIATGLPPSNDLESAIVRDFAPGGYTAIVRGSNYTTGVALVEAYSLD